MAERRGDGSLSFFRRWQGRGRQACVLSLLASGLALALAAMGVASHPQVGWLHGTRKADVADKVQLVHQQKEKWEVMYHGFVNVRKSKSLAALILGKHWKCEVLEGYREGDWVKLADEPGFIKIELAPYELLRKVPEKADKVEQPEHLAKKHEDLPDRDDEPGKARTFRLITEGTCSNFGMKSIQDERLCQEAADKTDHHSTVRRSQYVPSPEGCYLLNGQLWMAEDPANRGNGAVGQRHPFCVSTDSDERRLADIQCIPLPDHPIGKDGKATKSPVGPPATTSVAETIAPAAVERKAEVISDRPSQASIADITDMTHGPAKTPVTTSAQPATVVSVPSPASTKWKSPSLFCFEVTTVKPEDPNWYEPKLVKVQLQQRVSVFACDEFTVFSNGGKLILGGNWTTTQLQTPRVSSGKREKPGGTINAWLNALIFQKAWEEIMYDGRYKRHDWTVKVDPDAVFFPNRLRDLVRPHTKPAGAWYFLNCNRFPPSPPGEAKLHGAVEVFSRKAVEAYVSNRLVCVNGLDWQGWGEDFYMQKCMEKLGIMAVYMFKWIGDDRCWPAKCSAQDKVAFHDFKDIDAWFNCWAESMHR